MAKIIRDSSGNITIEGTVTFPNGIQKNGVSVGHLEYIGTFTTSATATFDLESTSVFGAGYDYIEIRIPDARSVNDDVEFKMLIGTGIGPVTYQTTTYNWSQFRQLAGTAGDTASTGAGTYIPLIINGASVGNGVGNAANEQIWLTIKIYNPDSATNYKAIEVKSSWITANGFLGRAITSGIWLGGLGALTGLQFSFETGNVNTISADVFGIKK